MRCCARAGRAETQTAAVLVERPAACAAALRSCGCSPSSGCAMAEQAHGRSRACSAPRPLSRGGWCWCERGDTRLAAHECTSVCAAYVSAAWTTARHTLRPALLWGAQHVPPTAAHTPCRLLTALRKLWQPAPAACSVLITLQNLLCCGPPCYLSLKASSGAVRPGTSTCQADSSGTSTCC